VIPIEAFVSNLSDHDYVPTVEAVRTVRPALALRGIAGWETSRASPRTSTVAPYRDLAPGDTG